MMHVSLRVLFLAQEYGKLSTNCRHGKHDLLEVFVTTVSQTVSNVRFFLCYFFIKKCCFNWIEFCHFFENCFWPENEIRSCSQSSEGDEP